MRGEDGRCEKERVDVRILFAFVGIACIGRGFTFLKRNLLRLGWREGSRREDIIGVRAGVEEKGQGLRMMAKPKKHPESPTALNLYLQMRSKKVSFTQNTQLLPHPLFARNESDSCGDRTQSLGFPPKPRPTLEFIYLTGPF